MLAIVAAAIGVEQRLPARIDVAYDTLIVNGFAPVATGARLINRLGASVWRPKLRFAADTESIVRVSDEGTVTCGGIGDGVVTVSKGALTKQMLVRCRPIVAWGFEGCELRAWTERAAALLLHHEEQLELHRQKFGKSPRVERAPVGDSDSRGRLTTLKCQAL